MTERMTIGEFSAATWLSPKAIRLYDDRGLLSPDTVDPSSGYRRYHPDQIATARLITLLRRIEMPLDQIAAILAVPTDARADRIARFRKDQAAEHARRDSLARFLTDAVRGGDLSDAHEPDTGRFEVFTRSVPSAAVLSSTCHTRARDLPDTIRASAERLFALAAQRGGANGRLMVIYHGQVGWESDGPIEICVPVRDQDRAHRVEPARQELCTTVPAEDVQFPRILAAFEAVRLGAEQLGFAAAGPPREIYAENSGGHIPGCDVALPVTPSPNRDTI